MEHDTQEGPDQRGGGNIPLREAVHIVTKALASIRKSIEDRGCRYDLDKDGILSPSECCNIVVTVYRLEQ